MARLFLLNCYKWIGLGNGWRGRLWVETYNFARLFALLTAMSIILPKKVVPLSPNCDKLSAIMAYSMTDKMEWTLIFAAEFGRRFGLTLKQAFNYLSRFGGIKFVDEHYDYCHTQSFQSMVNDMAEYCHRKGGALV